MKAIVCVQLLLVLSVNSVTCERSTVTETSQATTVASNSLETSGRDAPSSNSGTFSRTTQKTTTSVDGGVSSDHPEALSSSSDPSSTTLKSTTAGGVAGLDGGDERINWTLARQWRDRPRRRYLRPHYMSPVAHCKCDLKRGDCDLGCCCDEASLPRADLGLFTTVSLVPAI
jgi:hypothetical protein